jgi:hypothetical protein
MRRVLRPGGALVVEALNGQAAVALARRTIQRLRGWPSRVRAYRPSQMRGWLAAEGLALERTAPLRLPPRQAPWLERVIEARPMRAMLDAVPPLGEAATHSFLFVARRQGVSGGSSR